jgi:hypothetical protein
LLFFYFENDLNHSYNVSCMCVHLAVLAVWQVYTYYYYYYYYRGGVDELIQDVL